jgi:hypothetical protein
MRIAASRAGLRVKNVRYISFPFQFQASLAYALHPHALQPLETMWIGESRLIYWLLFSFVYLADFLRVGDVIEVTLS